MALLNEDKRHIKQHTEDRNESLDALKVVNSTHQKSMLEFIIDLPNLCTLCGLLSASLGIYFGVQGLFYFAVIGGA